LPATLRAGLVTSAASPVGDRAIMRESGHRSSAMVARYIDASLFRENAAAVVGL
jgi:hypothetical protein